MNIISKSELKTHMLRIFRKIEETGEEVVVTDHNHAVLKIIPYHETDLVDDLFEQYRGKVIYHEDINEPTSNEWDDK